MKLSIAARCASLALFLAGCGGGGGSGTPPPPPPPPPPVRTTSGLMPAAPALGTTLHADAATLRPFHEGAVWQYHGQSQWSATALPVHYDTTTTATNVSASGATETWSNSANQGPSDPLVVSVASGTVSSMQPLDLAGKGLPVTLNFVELRSPVRVGDQIPIVDQHIIDTGYDVDGDRKMDALDVAIYVRVIGAETVALDRLPSLQAVRVDSVLVARFTLSSNGQLSPTATTTISTWYAVGIGIVRQRASTVEGGVESDITDEMLVSYDRGDAGFGAMPEVAAIIPATGPDYPGQAVPGPSSTYATADVGTGVLLATALPGQSTNDRGVLLSRIDLRGHGVAAHAQPTLKVHGRFVGHAAGMLYLRLSDDNGNLLRAVELTRFDDYGRLIGSLGGAALDLTAGRNDVQFDQWPVAAADGNTLWLLWRRLTPTTLGRTSELVLRHYTLDGTPSGPEILVDTAEIAGMAIAADGGQVLLSWNRIAPGGYEAMVATARSADASVAPVRVAASLAWGSDPILPLRVGTQQALFWKSPLGGVTANGAGGMLLDADLQPLIASGSTIEQQVLTDITLMNGMVLAVGEGRIVQATPAYPTYPDGHCCTDGSQVRWFEPGSAPLTSAVRHVVSAPGLVVSRQVVLGDRVLLLGGSYDALVSRVVWLNAGP